MNDIKLLDQLLTIESNLKDVLRKVLHKKNLCTTELIYISELIKLYYVYHDNEEE